MIVEEQKAREKDCHLEYRRCCIGSSCMAWRWADEEVKRPQGKPSEWMKSNTHGFCGLAGRP